MQLMFNKITLPANSEHSRVERMLVNEINATSSMALHFLNSMLKLNTVELETGIQEHQDDSISWTQEILSSLTEVSFLSLHAKLKNPFTYVLFT